MTVRDLTILGCSSQQPTRQRSHGGYLMRWGEGLLFDPGDGTQRQLIFANIPPPVIHRIFISHFHGDHCFGLGPILARLNLDKVTHPIHIYFPASGKKYYQRLRDGTIYHRRIELVEHPVYEPGVVEEDERFRIEATFLQHSVDTIGWRITEPDQRKFDPEKLKAAGIQGPAVRQLSEEGGLRIGDRWVEVDEVSWIRKGDTFAVVMDTLFCPQAIEIARGATWLLCESTYLSSEAKLARQHLHMTATDAATIAKEAGVQLLILTHYSARYLDLQPFLTEAREIFPNTHLAKDLKRFDLRRAPAPSPM